MRLCTWGLGGGRGGGNWGKYFLKEEVSEGSIEIRLGVSCFEGKKARKIEIREREREIREEVP